MHKESTTVYATFALKLHSIFFINQSVTSRLFIPYFWQALTVLAGCPYEV